MLDTATTEGLFTEKQINYVDSIKAKDLRSHLLHQVRLRDLMEQDRDAFEKESNGKNSIQYAIKVLINALKTDEGYRQGWKANIAMAFKDEWGREGFQQSEQDFEAVHILANKSADNFLNLLCS